MVSLVVLVPSRRQRDYGDRWLTIAMEEANATSHWLIRNGENPCLMTTDPQVGDRPLPKREEFTEFFHTGRGFGRDRERVPLDVGSDAFAADMPSDDC